MSSVSSAVRSPGSIDGKTLDRVESPGMNTLLRNLDTILLGGIFVALILIFLQIRHPIRVEEPVAVQGWTKLPGPPLLYSKPIPVTIENEPLEVEISR